MKEKQKKTPAVVRLHEVVMGMELPNEEWSSYLNPRTGEVVTVTDDDRRLVESGSEGDDLPAWQLDAFPKIREALQSEEFLELPGKYEFHEFRVMEKFCHGVGDGDVREALLLAIRGRGAFRMFKDVARERGVLEAWYAYRDQALERLAIDWLDSRGIAYSSEKPSANETGA